jgi:sec-independent protein translocase protein TatC
MASIIDRVPFGPKRGRLDNQVSDEDRYQEPESFAEMTLQEHLEELRKRLMWSSLAILAALVFGLYFTFPVLHIIAEQARVPEEQLQVISPTEGFTTFFKVAIYIAVAIAMPVLIYQLMAFVAPGLTNREKRYVYMFLPMVMLFFVGGVLFSFFVLVPRALDFLSGFGSGVFEWNPRAEEIISFYLRLMLGVGIAFEMPVIILLLSKIGVVSTKRLSSFRKYAFLLVIVAAAIITPTPDPFNMMLVAIPLYILYELGVLFSRFFRPAQPRFPESVDED